MKIDDLEACCKLSKEAIGLYRKNYLKKLIEANDSCKYRKPFVLEEITDNGSSIKAYTAGKLKIAIKFLLILLYHLIFVLCNK